MKKKESVKKEALKKQRDLALILMLWRLPGTIASLIAAISSKSLFLWMEFIEEISIILPGIILIIIANGLKKDLKYKYNYGTGKVEAITALSCEMFDLGGVFCIVVLAIRSLIHGGSEEGEPVIALVATIIGVLFDLFMLRKEKKLVETTHSKILHTAYLSAQKEFAFEFIIIIALILEIIFTKRSFAVYMSPVLSLIMAVPFIVILIRHISGSVVELADRTLDEESQLKILKVMSEFYEDYESFGAIKSRISGNHKHIDIELKFESGMTFKEISECTRRMKKRMKEEIGQCAVNIVLKVD